MDMIYGWDDIKISKDGDEGLYAVVAFAGQDREAFLGEVQRLPGGRAWMAYDRKGKTLGRVFDNRALHPTRKAAVKTVLVTHNVKARG